MAADAPTDPTSQQGQGQGSDKTHQASAAHKQGEQQRSTTPGRVVLNQKAATQTRGNASDVLLAELDFNKIQLSGQGEGEGQANATIKNARAGYVHRWRQHIQTVGSDFAQSRTHLLGEVKLAATLNFQGRLTGYQILNSSGMSELDQAAIELLKRASPFDPFPNALVAYQTELTITSNLAIQPRSAYPALMNLRQHLLLAMPHQEGFFENAVVVLCEHDEAGALALLLTNPSKPIWPISSKKFNRTLTKMTSKPQSTLEAPLKPSVDLSCRQHRLAKAHRPLSIFISPDTPVI